MYVCVYLNGQKYYTICKSAFMNGCICNHVCVFVFPDTISIMYIKTGLLHINLYIFMHTNRYIHIQNKKKIY